MESERLLVLTDEAWKMVSMEIIRSRQLHPPMIDHFHAFGVIEEELGEFFDSIKKQNPDLSEIAQVVGCCIMTLQDTYNYRGKPYTFDFEDFVGTFSFKKVSSYHQVYAYLRLHFDKYWENVKNIDVLQEVDIETPLINMVDFGVSGIIFALGKKGK